MSFRSCSDQNMLKIFKSLYRLNILDSSRMDLSSKIKSIMPNTICACKFLISKAAKKAGYICEEPNIVFVKKESDFDYQCTDAMKIAKELRKIGKDEKPDFIAKKLINYFPQNKLVEELSISNPGFINIKLSKSYLIDFCLDILILGIRPPSVQKRIVTVDFSSPNIAKEMHVGHLRSTIIGESICRIFEFVGFEVRRISHIGDWGTQFGMLIAHLEDTFPNFDIDPPKISDLQAFYKESKKRFDDDETFRKRAYDKVVALQSDHDKRVTNAWKSICALSRASFQKIYKRLDVNVTEMGESFYQDRMVKLVNELQTGGFLKDENGCKVVHVPGFKVPLLIVKSDGGFTYDTSDLAAIRFRLKEQQNDWIIYVVDSGQREHFHTLFKFVSILGWCNPDIHRIEHLGFGVVLGEGGKKLKTRSGDAIKLEDLLDEGAARAQSVLSERGLDKNFEPSDVNRISEAVGYSCIKYADLSHNMVSEYEFSYDRMLDHRGDTAIYLMYAYTRIRSIIQKSKVSESDIIQYVSSNGIVASHNNEFKLMRKLIHFPEIIYKVVNQTFPHYLCEYLYELARTITEFYDSCQIMTGRENKPDMNRLAIIFAASLILKKGFDLVGITSLDRM